MERPNHNTKGNLQIMPILITAGATVVASALGAFGVASSRVNTIDTKVQVVEERENNHYQEVSDKLSDIDKKLDKIITNTR